jgi:hypothetical protein
MAFIRHPSVSCSPKLNGLLALRPAHAQERKLSDTENSLVKAVSSADPAENHCSDSKDILQRNEPNNTIGSNQQDQCLSQITGVY